jgi:hypothetical protein
VSRAVDADLINRVSTSRKTTSGSCTGIHGADPPSSGCVVFDGIVSICTSCLVLYASAPPIAYLARCPLLPLAVLSGMIPKIHDN